MSSEALGAAQQFEVVGRRSATDPRTSRPTPADDPPPPSPRSSAPGRAQHPRGQIRSPPRRIKNRVLLPIRCKRRAPTGASPASGPAARLNAPDCQPNSATVPTPHGGDAPAARELPKPQEWCRAMRSYRRRSSGASRTSTSPTNPSLVESIRRHFIDEPTPEEKSTP